MAAEFKGLVFQVEVDTSTGEAKLRKFSGEADAAATRVDKAATKIQGAGKKVEQGTTAASGGLSTFRSSLNSAGESLEKFGPSLIFAGAGLTGLYFGLKTAIEGIHSFVESGNELGKLERSFDSLTRAAGIAGDELLKGLAEATLGTVSNLDLMRTANKALLLDLPLTVQNFTQLAAATTKLGRAIGKDAGEALDLFDEAVLRHNNRGLRQIGITIDIDKANREYARGLGLTAASLNEAELRASFFTAALVEVQKKSELAGAIKAPATLAHEWEEQTVAVKNTGRELARLVNEAPDLILRLGRDLAPAAKQAFSLKGLENLPEEEKTKLKDLVFLFGSLTQGAGGFADAIAKVVTSGSGLAIFHQAADDLSKFAGAMQGPKSATEASVRLREALSVAVPQDLIDKIALGERSLQTFRSQLGETIDKPLRMVIVAQIRDLTETLKGLRREAGQTGDLDRLRVKLGLVVPSEGVTKVRELNEALVLTRAELNRTKDVQLRAALETQVLAIRDAIRKARTETGLFRSDLESLGVRPAAEVAADLESLAKKAASVMHDAFSGAIPVEEWQNAVEEFQRRVAAIAKELPANAKLPDALKPFDQRPPPPRELPPELLPPELGNTFGQEGAKGPNLRPEIEQLQALGAAAIDARDNFGTLNAMLQAGQVSAAGARGAASSLAAEVLKLAESGAPVSEGMLLWADSMNRLDTELGDGSITLGKYQQGVDSLSGSMTGFAADTTTASATVVSGLAAQRQAFEEFMATMAAFPGATQGVTAANFNASDSSRKFAEGTSLASAALSTAASVLSAAGGAHQKYARAVRIAQAGLMVVDGIKSIRGGAVKIAENLYPPNPLGITSGVLMIAAGTAELAAARSLGAGGGGASASSGGGGGGGGAGGGGAASVDTRPKPFAEQKTALETDGNPFARFGLSTKEPVVQSILAPSATAAIKKLVANLETWAQAVVDKPDPIFKATILFPRAVASSNPLVEKIIVPGIGRGQGVPPPAQAPPPVPRAPSTSPTRTGVQARATANTDPIVKLTETIEDLARSVTARPDPVLHASITLPQPAAAGPPSSTTTTVPGVPGLPGSHPYVPPTPPPPPSYVPGQPNPRPAPSPTRASREEADQASSGRAPTPVQITIQAVDAQSFREWVSRNRDARRTIAEVAFAGLTGKNA